MLKVLSDAFVAADSGQATLLGLLDLTAAFDTVDHAILIERYVLRLVWLTGLVDVVSDWSMSMSMSMSTVDLYSASPRPPLMRTQYGRTQYVRYRGEVSTAVYPRVRYSDLFSSCYM